MTSILPPPRGRRGRRLAGLGCALAGAMLALCSPIGVSAADAALPAPCSQSARTVTCTYASTGAEQQFTVPAAVSALHVHLIGGRGFGPAAAQADVVADLLVTPGQTLYVEVGGQGGGPTATAGGLGGWNGGGDGGWMAGTTLVPIAGFGGGGGASDLRTISRTDGTTLASRLVVAGGSGGFGGLLSGGAGVGGDAGDPNGHDAPGTYHGFGGTQTDGGFGLASGGLGYGGSGSLYDYTFAGGGGGGGGYYGGGAGTGVGGTHGGGGGGSSYGPAGTRFALRSVGFSDQPGGSTPDPSVTITYTAPDTTAPSIAILTPQDGAGYGQGASVAADYACSEEAGGTGLASCSGDVADGQPIDTATLGAHTFSVTTTDAAANTATTTVHYTVVADTTPPTIAIATPADGATFTLGATVLAGFSCADGPGGSGIASCIGDVDLHEAIDTATTGPHTLTVTATDVAGHAVTKTAHYTVQAPAGAPVTILDPVVLPGGTIVDSTSAIPDTTPPAVAITTPQDRAGQPQGSLVRAARASLRIALRRSASTVRRGHVATVTITITNNGPSAAQAVSTRIASGSGLRITGRRAATGRPRTALFEAASLASGASLTYHVAFVAAETASGEVSITARTSSRTPDPDHTDSTARTTLQISPQARSRGASPPR